MHEPAYDPDPDHYVTWEYARGYADGVHDTLTEIADDPDGRGGGEWKGTDRPATQ